MATYLIVDVDGTWHRATSFADRDVPNEDGSRSVVRDVELGCGEKATVTGDRVEETTHEPGGHRHVKKGCFSKQAS